jgi:hypothetical protein
VAGWKIKAVGAWGAYVTAFLLGLWTIKSTTVPLSRLWAASGVDDRFDFRFADDKETRYRQP